MQDLRKPSFKKTKGRRWGPSWRNGWLDKPILQIDMKGLEFWFGKGVYTAERNFGASLKAG